MRFNIRKIDKQVGWRRCLEGKARVQGKVVGGSPNDNMTAALKREPAVQCKHILWLIALLPGLSDFHFIFKDEITCDFKEIHRSQLTEIALIRNNGIVVILSGDAGQETDTQTSGTYIDGMKSWQLSTIHRII